MNLLLVDDHAIVREGYRRILSDALAVASFGEASDAAQALEQVRARRWTVATLDISLPGRSGLEVLKEIHQLRPRLPVLMVTMHAEGQYALRSFRAGAAGFLSKGCPPEELVLAVQKLAAGGRYVSPAMAEQLAGSLVSDTGRPLHEALSDRELQVLRMVANGQSVKEIAHALGLSDKTISTYRTRMLEKLDLRTSSQLIRYAIRSGLVD